MRLLLFAALLILSNINSFGQKIIGEWELPNEECSETLIIKDNGKYEILNDCYAIDSHNPIIENGEWKLSNDKKKLTLSIRDLSKGGGYKIWNAERELILAISIQKEILVISYLGKNESWRRLK